jgi:hypothetical protein
MMPKAPHSASARAQPSRAWCVLVRPGACPACVSPFVFGADVASFCHQLHSRCKCLTSVAWQRRPSVDALAPRPSVPTVLPRPGSLAAHCLPPPALGYLPVPAAVSHRKSNKFHYEKSQHLLLSTPMRQRERYEHIAGAMMIVVDWPGTLPCGILPSYLVQLTECARHGLGSIPAEEAHPTKHICPVLCSKNHLHRHVAPLSWLLNTPSLSYSLGPSRASISSGPNTP